MGGLRTPLPSERRPTEPQAREPQGRAGPAQEDELQVKRSPLPGEREISIMVTDGHLLWDLPGCRLITNQAFFTLAPVGVSGSQAFCLSSMTVFTPLMPRFLREG